MNGSRRAATTTNTQVTQGDATNTSAKSTAAATTTTAVQVSTTAMERGTALIKYQMNLIELLHKSQ